MASSPNRLRIVLVCIVALLASSAMLFSGTGIQPIWWMAWLAVLPVLLVAPRVSGLAAFGIAALSWFAGTLNLWRYLRHILVLPMNPHAGPLVMPVGIAIGVLVVPSILFGLAVLLTRAFMRRGALWGAALALPSVWITFEYLTSITSPHSTFGSIAYTQMDNLPMLQLASVFGIWGIIFCLFLLPAAIANLLNGVCTAARRRQFSATVAVLLMAVLVFGWWRLHSGAAGQSVVVGLSASDVRENVFPEDPEKKGSLFRLYAEQAGILAAQGAKVVVLPEKLVVVVDPETEEVDKILQQAATYDKVTIVAGVIRRSSSAKLNEARLYSPDGSAVLTYDKHHMLPAFESSFAPGTMRTRLDEPSGRWGMAICKDMDFPALSRDYGEDGIGLLLVPAWDFDDDAWLHSRMAVMRSVESGFSMARAAKQGLLTLNDNRGRILAERSSASATFATLVGTVPVRHDSTIYARFGDWFAWLNMVVLVFLVARLFVHSNRIQPEDG